MTSKELKERLNKAVENIAKAERSVVRNEKRVETAEDGIDRELAEMDLRRSREKLKDAKRIAENWKSKYEKQLQFELTLSTEIPEAFKGLQKHLAAEWTKSDLEEKELLWKKYSELDFREFCERYTYSRFDYLRSHKEAEIAKANEREAEAWILDLYNRIKKETGEPKTWANITVSPKGLNGFVEGENGKVIVETILAGGYNIQRLHYRVILHKSK